MRRRGANNPAVWRAVFRLVIAIILALLGKKKLPTRTTRQTPQPSRRETSPGAPAHSDIASLFHDRRGDVIVVGEGEVVKNLPDDLHDDDGSGQHQQFLVDVPGGVTVKIAHNLKFGRAPVREGDGIRFKGEYEFNDRGGCIHWTHHDPKGWHEDGWLEHHGKRYQ